MKIRLTLLICTAMLLCVMSGCGAKESEPETTEGIMAEATAEATAEPTTEPTTIPTEPPTAVEQLGYTLWDEAAEVARPEAWINEGIQMPLSNAVEGHYEDIQMQFAIVDSNGKEHRQMVNTTVDAAMYAFTGDSFGDIFWIQQKLDPFYQASKSENITYVDWISNHQDSKLSYIRVQQKIHGTQHYLDTIDQGIKMKDLRVGYTFPDIVDAVTGDAFAVKSTYDAWNPEVGSWVVSHEDSEISLQAWYTNEYVWDVQEGARAELMIIHELFVLTPDDYEALNICMGEYATGEAVPRMVYDDNSQGNWARGNIQDPEFTKCADYRFHFLGFDIPG